jgi:hypothetical protein
MRAAVCVMWCVVGAVRCAVCGVRYELCGVRYTYGGSAPLTNRLSYNVQFGL